MKNDKRWFLGGLSGRVGRAKHNPRHAIFYNTVSFFILDYPTKFYQSRFLAGWGGLNLAQQSHWFILVFSLQYWIKIVIVLDGGWGGQNVSMIRPQTKFQLSSSKRSKVISSRKNKKGGHMSIRHPTPTLEHYILYILLMTVLLMIQEQS